jgi:serine phosphatase RsbU (regulator of sigma subunit)
MAARLLSYHAVLEQDIAAKTAEIHRDLEVAREFQEALMPRTYPEIRSNGEAGGLRLSFHHIYKPTSSVGGDFFDVLKLSDHRAGIFIADVMGHGARSALVTAILRTLLQDLTKDAEDPALLLAQLNRQFTGIVMQSSQFLFASACYLVIDMKRRIVTYASAGHPAPLIADRRNRTVSSMIERLKDNPVLGLSLDSAYTRFTRFINEGDLFLLFTDGVFETLSPDGEEFGHDRLNRLVEQNLGQDVASLVETVIKNIDSFRGDMALMDDICLVGCEIRAGAGS